MIKKVAQSYQELEEFVQKILLNPNLKIKPELKERFNFAKEGLIEANESLRLDDNPFSDYDLTRKILGNIEESSLSEYKEEDSLLSRILYSLSITDSFEAEEIVSNLERLYQQYEPKVNVQETPEVTYTEEVFESSTDWYVSSGGIFSPQEKIYGPFKKEISAILFSILIHSSGERLEKTVAQKNEAIKFLRSFDKNIRDITNYFSPADARIVNTNLAGMIELALSEISPEESFEISIEGEIFNGLVEFLEKNITFSNSGKNIEEVVNYLNLNNIKVFAKNFLEIKAMISGMGTVNAPPEFNDADVVVTPSEESTPKVRLVRTPTKEEPKKSEETLEIVPLKSKKLEIPPSKVPAPDPVVSVLQTSSLGSITIINPENKNLLSDSHISEFIRDMRDKSEALSSVTDNDIRRSLSNCFDQFKKFFKDCLDKDKEIKKEIIRFREQNKLIVNQAWNATISPEWEFQNKFSITKRIMEDPTVSKNLQTFFAKLVEFYFFGEDGKILANITSKVKSYNSRFNVKKSEEQLQDIAYLTLGDVLSSIRVTSSNILKDKINEIVSSPDLDFFDTSTLIDSLIINNIKINSQIFNKINSVFQSKENVIEQQSYYAITCGVCGQTTQVPSEYKDEILSFSNIESQYSFFREDGSFISDSELEKTQYFLSEEIKEVISSIIKKAYSKLSAMQVDRKVFEVIRKGYSWSEVNKMIYRPESFGDKSEDKVLENTVGIIIRNDILKQVGAIPAGSKNIFSNKTLCAASLIKMAESIKQDVRIKKNLDERRDYACLAKVKGNYSPTDIQVPEYQSVAYTSFSGPSLSKESDISGFETGYRFSRNVAYCPCHIKSDSIVSNQIKEDPKSLHLANLIAFPNLPENVADLLSKKEGFDGSKEDLYFSPTTPDGSLASRYELGDQNLSGTGYLVCGKKVSLSMFDKDPGSKNYIRNVLSKIIKESGKNSFISAVKILIDHGVEMNDLKPHVESVLSENVSLASRKKILNSLYKTSKISIGQDYSKELYLIKDLGLTCESGHRFTLDQSWRFAETHSGINLSEKRRAKSVKRKTILSLLELDNNSVFRVLASNQTDFGLGIIKTTVSEKDLRDSGFLMPNEITNISQYREILSSKKLYFKSDDGSVYTIGTPIVGYYDTAPWQPGSFSQNSRTDLKISTYTSGVQSTTVTNEDGGVVEADIADTSSLSADEELDYKFGYSNEVVDLAEKYNLKEVLYATIPEEEINNILKRPEFIVQEKEEYLRSKASEFSDKFIKLLKMSRVWGKMASDYQIDFLSQVQRKPDLKPDLEVRLKNILNDIIYDLNISSGQEGEIHSRFFDSYDFIGLANRNISFNQFLSLSGMAQYYRGFSVPFIANLSNEEAAKVIENELSKAVKENFGYIFGVEKRDMITILSEERINNYARDISLILLSPYQEYLSKLDFIQENSTINYTGRAIVFSYAIDIVNSIKLFYAKHFFNRSSSLYIGPSEYEGFSNLNDLLKMVSLNESGSSTPVPNILIMSEDEFNAKIEKIKQDLFNAHDIANIFSFYLKSKGISIPDENSRESSAYRAIVCTRLAKCLQMASSSLDYIINSIALKPLGSKDTFAAAQALDSSIEYLMKQRDPQNFEENKQRILSGRMIFGEEENIFQKNAVQYGRIKLDSASIPIEDRGEQYLAPMVFSRVGNYNFIIEKEYLTNGNNYKFKYGVKIDEPYLILLHQIVLNDNTGRTLYICMVPKDIIISEKIAGSPITDISKNIDMMSLIPPDAIRLNTEQGLEFASRYIPNLLGLDKSRLILVDSKIKKGSLFVSSTVDSAIESSHFSQNIFDIRIQKIEEPPAVWPPPNNMLVDNYNIARSPDDNLENLGLNFYSFLKNNFGDRTENVERYYQALFGLNNEEFLAKLNIFRESISSKTMIPSSSHGLVLPVGGSSSEISNLINVTSREIDTSEKIGMTISDLKISVPRDGKNPLDISWAFLANNPQFVDEGGLLKNRLVQSGVIQKLSYISFEIKKIFSWFSSENARKTTGDLAESFYSNEISFFSQESFLNSILSEDSAFVRMELDSSSGLVLAYPYSNNIISDYPPDSIIPIEEYLQKLNILCDFYNAAKKLNKIYMEQKPLLDSCSAINLAKKDTKLSKSGLSQKALMIRLLDPYSLWAMISNPAMRTDFGGPINSDDIDDYKQFIISMFGLENLRSYVLEKTGFSENEFKVEDLFDLSSFYKKFKEKTGSSKNADKLEKLIGVFKLKVEEDSGELVTHRFGVPVFETKSNEELSRFLKSMETSEYSVHPDSYVEYPAKLSNSLDDLTEAQIKQILKEADNDAKDLYQEVAREISSANPKVSKRDLAKMVSSDSRIVKRKMEFVSNHPIILESRRKASAIRDGEEILSLDRMVSLAVSRFSTERPKLLSQEIIRIVKELWTSPTKKISREISRRKIAQIQTDDDGTIIRSLYHKWWDAYLKIVAQTQN